MIKVLALLEMAGNTDTLQVSQTNSFCSSKITIIKRSTVLVYLSVIFPTSVALFAVKSISSSSQNCQLLFGSYS